MTSAEARDQFEAAVWRALSLGPRWSKTVDSILAAADSYAEHVADERIAGHVASRTTGRDRLAEAATEKFERKGNING